MWNTKPFKPLLVAIFLFVSITLSGQEVKTEVNLPGSIGEKSMEHARFLAASATRTAGTSGEMAARIVLKTVALLK